MVHTYVTPLKYIIIFSATAHWRLDLRENSLRQHLQLLANPSGGTHEEAVRKASPLEEGEEGEEGAANTLSVPTLPSPRGGHLTPEDSGVFSEDLLEALVSPDEQMAQLFSITCRRVVMAHAVQGTLVFTSAAVAFTADDTCEEYDKVLSMVSLGSLSETGTSHD